MKLTIKLTASIAAVLIVVGIITVPIKETGFLFGEVGNLTHAFRFLPFANLKLFSLSYLRTCHLSLYPQSGYTTFVEFSFQNLLALKNVNKREFLVQK